MKYCPPSTLLPAWGFTSETTTPVPRAQTSTTPVPSAPLPTSRPRWTPSPWAAALSPPARCTALLHLCTTQAPPTLMFQCMLPPSCPSAGFPVLYGEPPCPPARSRPGPDVPAQSTCIHLPLPASRQGEIQRWLTVFPHALMMSNLLTYKR